MSLAIDDVADHPARLLQQGLAFHGQDPVGGRKIGQDGAALPGLNIGGAFHVGDGAGPGVVGFQVECHQLPARWIRYYISFLYAIRNG